jgi:hypothetical protein
MENNSEDRIEKNLPENIFTQEESHLKDMTKISGRQEIYIFFPIAFFFTSKENMSIGLLVILVN